MSFLFPYLSLALFVFAINVAPAFAPPTWLILVLASALYHLPFLAVITIGAIFSTLGRMSLYWLSGHVFIHILSKKAQKNMEDLGTYLNQRKNMTLPVVALFAFSPIPSNHFFIAFGFAKFDWKWLSTCFFVGRLINYALLVGTSGLIAGNINSLFNSKYGNWGMLLLELVGFAGIFLLTKIKWEKYLVKSV